MSSPSHFRRLGEGAAVFDPRTWQSHILTPAATIVVEALLERGEGASLPLSEARACLREELGVDPDSPDYAQMLAMLVDIGVVRP